MAELATIARPYAEALFQAERSDLSAAQEWLDALAAVAADDQLLEFAADPRVDAQRVFQLVSGLLPKALPERGANFLRVVIDNERLAALPEVARQFRALISSVTGEVDAVVYSAFPIAEQDLKALKLTLEKRFGCQLRLRVEQLPDLIGGIRVKVGDEVLDTSVRARLQQMKMALSA